MVDYRKPLVGGGSRIIPRGVGGRFTRSVLAATPCPNPECRAIVPDKPFERANGFVVPGSNRPTHCPRCGGAL